METNKYLSICMLVLTTEITYNEVLAEYRYIIREENSRTQVKRVTCELWGIWEELPFYLINIRLKKENQFCLELILSL